MPKSSDSIDVAAEVRSLCHRCEHRARWYETGGRWQPRCECAGTPGYPREEGGPALPPAVYSCYMYKPVAPIVVAPNDGDTRPIFGPAMLSARTGAVRVAEGTYGLHKEPDGFVAYWKPSRQKRKSK